MSILKNLVHSRDKPKNSLPGSSYNVLFGRTTSGKNVNERTAMQVTAVYACVRILSEAIAGLPLHYLLHDEPNPGMIQRNCDELHFVIRTYVWITSYKKEHHKSVLFYRL